MRLDGMRRHDDDEIVDAVVVGTGASGAPLLASLARAGLRVVALEAGPNFDERRHTPDEVDAAEVNWMQDRLSGGVTPTAFGPNNSGRGVGGSTLHWGAFIPRPDARDLRLRTETGRGADWPIPYRGLVGWIERVERYLGVSGPAHYPWDPGRRYPLPPPTRNAPAEAIAAGCEALGIRATDAPAALVTRDRHQEDAGLRQACVACGSCHQGCRTGAKVSMDTSYLPAAVARGAEIRPDSQAIGFELDEVGRVAAVVYRREGVERRQRCRTVVLSAGGVETPRLLLHAGLANSSDQVGRNFMAHGGIQAWGRMDVEVRGYRGYPSAIISEDMVRPADADFVGGYLLQSLGVQPLTFATGLVRGAGLWGRDLVERMMQYRSMVGIGINGECLPADDNRLVLSAEMGEDGVPRAHVSFSAGGNEKAIDRHATATMTRILEAAGARDVFTVQRSAHTLGTCRMGADPATSVVDPVGRSHDIDNLWICDTSIFPSSLSANPGLTAMALGLRTAEAVLAAA